MIGRAVEDSGDTPARAAQKAGTAASVLNPRHVSKESP